MAIDDQKSPADLVELGHITSAYSLQGWIKIHPYSIEAEVLQQTKQWWLNRLPTHSQVGIKPSMATMYSVLACHLHGSSLIAHLNGVYSRDQAESLRGMTVYVSRSLFPVVQKDEYYWIDLVGCELFNVSTYPHVLMGTVIEVLTNGAHDTLRVKRQLDSPKPISESLIPFVNAHILAVDLDARRIDTNWPLDF